MNPSVLIVDDVADTRAALAELLEASGEFDVAGEAADGQEAVEAAARLNPDMIIMDIRMPNLDGIEATRTIVAAGHNCQIIAHSAYQDVSLVRDMIAAGAKGYVLKGSDADRLLATLRAAMLGHAVVAPEVTRALLDDLQQLYSHQVAHAVKLQEQVGTLQDAAMRDHLTGLGNHRAFHERLEHEVLAAGSARGVVSVAMLDLDDFKLVNDVFGHALGDQLITDVAAIVERAVGERGAVYRIGGDELAVILPGVDSIEAARCLEEVRDAVAGLESGSHRHQTISIGLATYPAGGPNKDYLLSAADEAMYDAKSRGKNLVCVFGGDSGRSRLPRQLGDATERAVITAVSALGARDAGTMDHCQAASAIAEAIAEELALTPAEIETVRLGALLHDVGMIGMPDTVLAANERTRADHLATMQRHPDIGRVILGRVLPRAVIECITCHHEQPDGKGYPLGLSSSQIPFTASIVRVADAFESLVSERATGPQLDRKEALREMQRGAGTLFDAEAVAALTRIEGRSERRAA